MLGDTSTALRDVQKRKKLAEELMKQGAEKTPLGQMVSGHFIANSPIMSVVNGLKGLGGTYMMGEAQKDEDALRTQDLEQKTQILTQALGKRRGMSQGDPIAPQRQQAQNGPTAAQPQQGVPQSQPWKNPDQGRAVHRPHPPQRQGAPSGSGQIWQDPQFVQSMMRHYPKIGQEMLKANVVPTTEMRNLQNAGVDPRAFYDAKMQSPEQKVSRDKIAQDWWKQQQNHQFGHKMHLQNDSQAHDNYMAGVKYGTDVGKMNHAQQLKNQNTVVNVPQQVNGQRYNVPMTQQQHIHHVSDQRPQQGAASGSGFASALNLPQNSQYNEIYNASSPAVQQGMQQEFQSGKGAVYDNAHIPALQNNPMAIPVQTEQQKQQRQFDQQRLGKASDALSAEYQSKILPGQETLKKLEDVLSVVSSPDSVNAGGIMSGIYQFGDKHFPEALGADRQQAHNTDRFDQIMTDIGSGRLQMFGGSDTNQDFIRAVEGAGGDRTKLIGAIEDQIKAQQGYMNDYLQDYNTRRDAIEKGDYLPPKAKSQSLNVQPSQDDILAEMKRRGLQ